MKTGSRFAACALALLIAGCAYGPPPEETPARPAVVPSPDELRLEAMRWAMAVSDKIKSNWARPAKTPPKFSCTVELDVTPQGAITDAKLRKTCGSQALDQSVLQAVRKSEPLPLPANPAAFDPELVLHFVP